MNTNTFDFFVGTWTSKQRRLREALAGSDDPVRCRRATCSAVRPRSAASG
ncbi:hypothetical protein ACIBI9_14545 [Nonomuraea sp. NPDC050451]